MEITKTIQNGTIVLSPVGCLDTAAAADFDAALEAALAESKSIRLDFSGLEFISSAALRSIVAARRKLTGAGGAITLKSLPPVVREVFEMTGLLNVFTVEE